MEAIWAGGNNSVHEIWATIGDSMGSRSKRGAYTYRHMLTVEFRWHTAMRCLPEAAT